MPDYAFTVPQVQPVRQSSLADMLTMARGAQAYQQEQQMNPLELRAKQMQVEQAAAVNPLELARIGAESRVATGTEAPRIAQAGSAARGAEAVSNSQQLENLQRQQANFSRESLKLLQNKTLTPKDINDFLVKTIKNAGGNDTVIAQAQSAIPTEGTTADMKAWLARHSLNSLTAESQIEKLFPSATAVNTGAGITPMTFGSPFLSVTPPGTSAGPTTPLEVPPTTQLVAQPGDNTGLPPGTPYLLGPQGPKAIGAPKPPMTTGLAPSVASTLASSATAANDDWKQTLQTAQMAPQRIAVFQNIKKLAPESFTGVGGERKALLAGLAQSVGIPAFELEKTATDELIKNTKLLAIAGGNTDAARQLAEVANPNSKMTLSAIKGVADQLIGVEKMNTARFNYLMPFREDPSTYQQKMAEFTPLMDSRLYQEISPAEFKKLVNSMSAADKADISSKIKLGIRLGVIK
jgi:hypothetical protein